MLDWIQSNIPPWVFIALIIHVAITGTVAYLILLERKVASWAQDRLGPNRVGPFGLLQPIADGIKMLTKEDYRPRHVDKVLFTVAPAVMIIVIIISIAVLPWGGVKQSVKQITIPAGGDVKSLVQAELPGGAWAVATDVYEVPPGLNYKGEEVAGRREVKVTYRWPFQIANLNIGVLFIVAVLSLAVYGVVIGGWSSNNKYSFLGGLRATAQMVSYEIPLGLSILTVVVMFGTLDLAAIVDRQIGYWGGILPKWNVFCQPVAFLMFLVCIHAEANRAPFDLAEAEQELVGGYHTEYSAMRFGLFFLAEYAGMITTSAVCVALFFGGWHLPYLDKIWPTLSYGMGPTGQMETSVSESILICIVRSLIIYGKTLFFIFVFMWVRWSLPRFRFDQLMGLAWSGMIPLTLALLLVTGVTLYAFGDQRGLVNWGGTQQPGPIPGKMALILLAVNLLFIVGVAVVSKMLPAAKNTNRKIALPHSRFSKTPLPAGVSNS